MKVYEFGKEENPAIMLLPGTCSHWKNNFSQVIDLLSEDFYVLCVSYDGFDETEETEFPDMIMETIKIEDYIRQKFQGRIHAIYGCSLGGSFVGLLTQRKRIHMNHGILGSSDLDQASKQVAALQAKLMIPFFYKMVHTGKVPEALRKHLLKNGGEEYVKNGLRMLGIGGVNMAFVTKKSMKNQFYSDLTTQLDDNIQVPGTIIHCFYAARMGEKYRDRYQQHFVHPHIIEHKLLHEELLVSRPEVWVENVRSCIS